MVGLGRFGAGLAAEPAHRGAEVPAIDIRREATRALDIPGVTFAVADATDSGSLTSAELVRRLQVSPASISKAVGYLEAQELIRRERDPRRRAERYVIDDSVWYQAMVASARANALLADTARYPWPDHPRRRPAGEHEPVPHPRRRRPGPLGRALAPGLRRPQTSEHG
ncbi:hypothetical protein Aros01_04666 [Streptosporangium roseum]